jgi:hypothetical protein
MDHASYEDAISDQCEITGDPRDCIARSLVHQVLGPASGRVPKAAINAAVSRALHSGISSHQLSRWSEKQRKGLRGTAQNDEGLRVYRGVRWREGHELKRGELDHPDIVVALKSQLSGDGATRLELFESSCDDDRWSCCLQHMNACFQSRSDGVEVDYLNTCWRSSLTAVRFSREEPEDAGVPIAVVTFTIVGPRSSSQLPGIVTAIEDHLTAAGYGNSVYLPLILARKGSHGAGRQLVRDVHDALQRVIVPAPLRLITNPPPESEPLKNMYTSERWGFHHFKDEYFITDERLPLSVTAAMRGLPASNRFRIIPRTYHDDAFFTRLVSMRASAAEGASNAAAFTTKKRKKSYHRLPRREETPVKALRGHGVRTRAKRL